MATYNKITPEIAEQLKAVVGERRFFMGEEDYNLAMRAKINHDLQHVILSDKIYHKVGESSSRIAGTDGIVSSNMSYHLNRFIDMKLFYKKQQWNVWRMLSSAVIFIKSVKNHYPIGDIVKYLYDLNRLSKKMNGVTRDDFFAIRTNSTQQLLARYLRNTDHK